jgi:hypothetical protein
LDEGRYDPGCGHPPAGVAGELSRVRRGRPTEEEKGAVMAEIPRIVSVDDHVVEPAHVWEKWLPARFVDRGPKVERRGVGPMRHVGGGSYEITWDPEAPKADCWVFGDLVYVNKRHVAAAGFSRDEMTMTPITYDEMRAGCHTPTARIEDM